MSQLLIKLSLEGLTYYHTYHRMLLYCSNTASYIGWILFTLIVLLSQSKLIIDEVKKNKQLIPSRLSKIVPNLFAFAATSTSIVLMWISVKFSYYVYCLLPYAIWYFVFINRFVLLETIKISVKMPCNFLISVVKFTLLSFFGVFGLVTSFFHR